jgi:hypothetical protein
MAIKFVTRADVQKRCMAKWAPALKLAEEVGMRGRVVLPDWDRLRNYEMEETMQEQFGDHWIVVEWCPFNGIFCRYKEVASKADLRMARENIAAVPASEGLNKPYLFGFIDEQLAKRPDDLPEKRFFQAGAEGMVDDEEAA